MKDNDWLMWLLHHPTLLCVLVVIGFLHWLFGEYAFTLTWFVIRLPWLMIRSIRGERAFDRKQRLSGQPYASERVRGAVAKPSPGTCAPKDGERQ